MTSAAEHALAVHELRLAAETGEQVILSSVLDQDVRLLIDGGGTVLADNRTIRGAFEVAGTLYAELHRAPTLIDEHDVNGRCGLVLRRAGQVTGIVSVEVRNHFVTELWMVLNPDKLRHWNE